jgi:hypothetical protein
MGPKVKFTPDGYWAGGGFILDKLASDLNRFQSRLTISWWSHMSWIGIVGSDILAI